MSERLYTFAVDELQTITCKCPKCGNVITYGVLTDQKYGIPAACPTCNQSLDYLTKALREYRDFYQTAKDSGLTIRIHTRSMVSDEV